MSAGEIAAACNALSDLRYKLEEALSELAIKGIATLAREAYPNACWVYVGESDQESAGVTYEHIADVNDSQLLSEPLTEGSLEDAMWDFICHLRPFLMANAAHVNTEGTRNAPYWAVDINGAIGEVDG